MERHILREGTSSYPISFFFWEPGGANTCTHWQSVSSETTLNPDWLRIPGSTLDSDWPDCLNLTAWFSYHVVSFRLHTCSTGLPRRTAIPPFTNHNVTACQSTRGHQERNQIHVNSHYITHPYRGLDTTATWKQLRFILSDRFDFRKTNSLSRADHTFARRVLMPFSVDEMLLPREVNLSTSFKKLLFRVKMPLV